MKKTVAFLLLVLFSLGVIGCGSGQKDPGTVEKTITIGVMPDVESVPFIIAEKNGYFEKAGVKVKLQPFKSAKDRDSALQGGQLDGIITDVLAVVFANEGGIGMKIVSRSDGDIKLLAGNGSGIDTVAQLKDKDIGISTNTIMEYTLDKMLAAGGLKPEDVNKVAIPPLPTRLEMLQGGKIDGAILPDPLAGLAVQGGAGVLNSTDQMGNKAGAIAFTDQALQQYPAEVKAVFNAYNEAVRYLREEPTAEDRDYIIQVQGFPSQVKDSLQLPAYQEANAPNPQVVADVVQWMRDKNLIKENYEYKDLVDDRVLR